jgi:hypothetical protein
MLTIYEDTPTERKRQPKLFERNWRGEWFGVAGEALRGNY